ERLEVRARFGLEHVACPEGACDRVRGELLEVDLAEDAEVVVAGEAEGRALPHRRDARIRPGPVADEVAQAPQLVRRLAVDGLENRLERVPVSVNVRDDRDAAGQGLNLMCGGSGVGR